MEMWGALVRNGDHLGGVSSSPNKASMIFNPNGMSERMFQFQQSGGWRGQGRLREGVNGFVLHVKTKQQKNYGSAFSLQPVLLVSIEWT